MKYNIEDSQKEVLKNFPEFKPYWEKNKSDWEGKNGEPPTLWGFMAIFSHYISENLLKMNQNSKREIFDFLETLLVYGDEDVDNAVCTCFLENLVNITPERIPAESYAPFLGKKSLKFCVDWGLKLKS